MLPRAPSADTVGGWFSGKAAGFRSTAGSLAGHVVCLSLWSEQRLFPSLGMGWGGGVVQVMRVHGFMCFWGPRGRGFGHPGSSDLQAPWNPGVCMHLLERIGNSWGWEDGRAMHNSPTDTQEQVSHVDDFSLMQK